MVPSPTVISELHTGCGCTTVSRLFCKRLIQFALMLQGYTTSWRTCSSSSSSEPPAADIGALSETIGHYDRLVQCGSLREDALQRDVAQQLAQLQHTLKNYSNSVYLNPPPPRLHSKDNSQLAKDKDPHSTSDENKGGGSTAEVKGLSY